MIADLPGRTSGTVLLGAHLDSVAAGPGMNDNGIGTALVLEVARQARRLGVRPERGLRFAFWGAEELGLVGSTAYVQSLSSAERGRLAGVLNFDMVGSPNFGRFFYDGATGPPGSARIEQLFRDYFAAHGQPAQEIDIQGASDHAPFAQAGIPVGGIFTGADEVKSADQARRWRLRGSPVRRVLPPVVRHRRQCGLRRARPARGRRRRRRAPAGRMS